MSDLAEHSKEDKTAGRDVTGVVAGKSSEVAASPGAKSKGLYNHTILMR